MSGVHELEFEKKRPTLVHLDAPAAFRRDRIVVSYDWANDRDYLVIKLALVDGSDDTLVLRRHVAERLQQLIQRLDRKNWNPANSSAEIPPAPPAKPQARSAAKPAPQPIRKAAAAVAHTAATRRAKPASRPAKPSGKARPAKAKAKSRR